MSHPSSPPLGALATIHQPARPIPVAAGSHLAHVGHPTTSHFVVVTGILEARVGDEVVAHSGPGEVAGGLLEVGEARTADLVALTDAVVLELPVAHLRTDRPALARASEAA